MLHYSWTHHTPHLALRRSDCRPAAAPRRSAFGFVPRACGYGSLDAFRLRSRHRTRVHRFLRSAPLPLLSCVGYRSRLFPADYGFFTAVHLCVCVPFAHSFSAGCATSFVRSHHHLPRYCASSATLTARRVRFCLGPSSCRSSFGAGMDFSCHAAPHRSPFSRSTFAHGALPPLRSSPPSCCVHFVRLRLAHRAVGLHHVPFPIALLPRAVLARSAAPTRLLVWVHNAHALRTAP